MPNYCPYTLRILYDCHKAYLDDQYSACAPVIESIALIDGMTPAALGLSEGTINGLILDGGNRGISRNRSGIYESLTHRPVLGEHGDETNGG